MVDLLELQKNFILSHLGCGDFAVDFTMGNGHDTEFLSKTVGEKGKVIAFDIQEKAIISTEKRLKETNCPENYTLLNVSHHLAANYIKEPIKAGMFNLGYMPGSGNKNITTMRETTLPAIKFAVSVLDKGGILVIAVYPGHSEGKLEGEEIENYLSALPKYNFGVGKFEIINSEFSPYFMIVEN